MLNGLLKRMLGRGVAPMMPAVVPQSDEWASLDLDPELSAPRAAAPAPQLSDAALDAAPAATPAPVEVVAEDPLQSFALIGTDSSSDDMSAGELVLDTQALIALADPEPARPAPEESAAAAKPARKSRRRAEAPPDAPKPRRRAKVDF